MLLIVLALVSLPLGAVGAEGGGDSLRVLFSHDLHSNLEPVAAQRDGQPVERGGVARLGALIKQIREQEGEVLLVDAGDFAMGTLYQTVFTTEAPELRLLGRMDYDAVALGNHEFDAGSAGLTAMLHTALDSGDELPALVCSNIDWKASRADEVNGADAAALQEALRDYGVQNYTIVEKNGLRIAVFGLMGKEAALFAPMSDLVFKDPIEAAREVVAELQDGEEPPDMIVCLSHSGIWDDPERSEDELLAAAVPELDLIISGHTHTELPEPIMIGSTTIAAAGCYGANLGSMTLARTASGRWQAREYRLIPVDDTIAADVGLNVQVAAIKKKVQRQYLNLFGYKFDQVLAYNPYNFTPFESFARDGGEDPLGNLIADAYTYAVQQIEGSDGAPVDIAVTAAGIVRASLDAGQITVAEAFKVNSLGSGPDGLSGYPLISFYMSGADVKTMAELNASLADFKPDFRLYGSGVSYTFNPHRLFLNRVTEIKLRNPNGTYENIEDERLYRCVTGLYSLQMLAALQEASHGLLAVTPCGSDGAPITDYSEHIIYDAGGNELKEWKALASYLESFPKENGVAVVPAYYQTTHDRIIIEDSAKIIDLVKQPNTFALILLGAALAILLLLVLVVRSIIKKIRRPRRGYRF